MQRQPRNIIIFVFISDVALNSRILSWVFCLQMNYIVKIVPEGVITLNMFLKSASIPIKSIALNITDKTTIIHVIFCLRS